MSAHDAFMTLKQQMSESIIGQVAVIDRVLIALVANGHILVEGLPGLAKTRTIKSLAKHLDADFKRIQFTPDLLPSDVTGTEIYYSDAGKGTFQFQPGPVFGNIILADEINRAPAKAQAALLEAMEERQVTVAGNTHALPEVYMVMATQNPIEQEGTYPLPEAQMDRFLMKLLISYPTDDDEVKILRLVRGEETHANADSPAKMTQSQLLAARSEASKVFVAPELEKYFVSLVAATRRPEQFSEKLKTWIQVGASPRGTLALDRASRAYAWLGGKDHASPDDVRAIAPDCLRHRIILSYDAAAEGVTTEQVISEIIEQVALP